MAVAPLNKFLTVAFPVAPGEQTVYTTPTGVSAIVLYAQVANVGINTINNPLNGITGLVKVTGYAKITSGSSTATLRINEPYGTDASVDWDGENFTAYMLADGNTDDIAIYIYANNITIEVDNISAKLVTHDLVAYYPLDGVVQQMVLLKM